MVLGKWNFEQSSFLILDKITLHWPHFTIVYPHYLFHEDVFEIGAERSPLPHARTSVFLPWRSLDKALRTRYFWSASSKSLCQSSIFMHTNPICQVLRPGLLALFHFDQLQTAQILASSSRLTIHLPTQVLAGCSWALLRTIVTYHPVKIVYRFTNRSNHILSFWLATVCLHKATVPDFFRPFDYKSFGFQSTRSTNYSMLTFEICLPTPIILSILWSSCSFLEADYA